jgi:hypothetical protein
MENVEPARGAPSEDKASELHGGRAEKAVSSSAPFPTRC